MQPQAQLSPPWYTLWNEIKASLGNDPAVTVHDLDTTGSPFVVPITIADHGKAVATASVTALLHQLGNIAVKLQITDADGDVVTPTSPGSPEELAALVQTALKGNGWLSTVVSQPVTPGGATVVWAVCNKGVVQFFNDDLSDLYHNYNNVAASVFRAVLNPAPGGFRLMTSTAKD